MKMNPQSDVLRTTAVRSGAVRSGAVRNGVTIIEVLFAIGVILIGLVGVVAIIPIAGRDAGEALRLDAANRMAESVLSELKARDLESMGGLIYNDIDPLSDDLNYQFTHQRIGVSNGETPLRPGALGLKLVAPFVDRPVLEDPSQPAGTTPAYYFKGLDSPSFAQRFVVSDPTYRTTRMASFCLDPDFFMKNTSPNLTGTRNGYQPARFPYYSEWYRPWDSPTAAVTVGGSRHPHPRMYRVGVSNASGTGLAPALLADVLTHADSSLMMHRPKDRSLEPSQIVQNLDSSNQIAGSRSAAGRYSWIATITPPIAGSTAYTVTVVIIQAREAFAGIDPAVSVSDAKTNPQSERLFWVANPISLGSTVQVTVIGPETVDHTIRPGEWVMLSRQGYQVVSGNYVPAANGPGVHRWFRVQRVTAPETGPLAGTWQKTVVLEGPNWGFGDIDIVGGLNAEQQAADDTYMTVIDGAISIKESTIEIAP